MPAAELLLGLHFKLRQKSEFFMNRLGRRDKIILIKASTVGIPGDQ